MVTLYNPSDVLYSFTFYSSAEVVCKRYYNFLSVCWLQELERNWSFWHSTGEECGIVTKSQEWKSLTCRRNNNSEEENFGEAQTVRSNDGWMAKVEEERSWHWNTSFPLDPEFGCSAWDDFTSCTWIHRFTHKAGWSFWAGIFQTAYWHHNSWCEFSRPQRRAAFQ